MFDSAIKGKGLEHSFKITDASLSLFGWRFGHGEDGDVDLRDTLSIFSINRKAVSLPEFKEEVLKDMIAEILSSSSPNLSPSPFLAILYLGDFRGFILETIP
jgi:hypothetical protein